MRVRKRNPSVHRPAPKSAAWAVEAIKDVSAAESENEQVPARSSAGHKPSILLRSSNLSLAWATSSELKFPATISKFPDLRKDSISLVWHLRHENLQINGQKKKKIPCMYLPGVTGFEGKTVLQTEARQVRFPKSLSAHLQEGMSNHQCLPQASLCKWITHAHDVFLYRATFRCRIPFATSLLL